jgi:RNA polymerase sigma factor (sigma-70 family)
VKVAPDDALAAALQRPVTVVRVYGMDTRSGLMIHSNAMTTVPLVGDFESTYRTEYPALVAVARAMTGDWRDCEDLVQDTMVKAYLRWDRVGRLDRPGGWCHRVLLNACTSLFRRRRVEQRFRSHPHVREAATDGPSADVIAFWDIVRMMPARPRTVVTLHYAGGHSFAEIARILGVPDATVRSDWLRARTVLARELGAGS